ncbi:MAG: Fic family protein [Acidobacteriota bacterium]
MDPLNEVREEATRTFDPREADARYKPFPSFAEWLAKSTVDSQRWERYAEAIRKLRATSPDLLPRALEVVKRAAAWDTGAIEGLYPTDRGFTLTVAMEVTAWESLVEQRGANARALFESQLKAYDYVLDFATQEIPIAEAWIRKLHEVVCESQDTYEVQTSIGKQHQPLPKGEYKQNPNHVVQRDGSIHSWSPVDLTPAEMHRLCEELRSEAFNAAHPIIQAAYAHYAFVSVHPFADGNGRVARALASVFTYRAESIPLLILKGDAEYLPALEAADSGDVQRFVDFILEKAIDTIRLTEDSFKAAKAPNLEAALNELTGLYLREKAQTDARDFSDGIATSLFNAFRDRINERLDSVDQPNVVSIGSVLSDYRAPLRIGYRVRENRAGGFALSSADPFRASVQRRFQVEVPNDAKGADNVLIRSLDSDDVFEAAVSELSPEPTVSVRMRLSVWSEKLIAEALNELSTRAAALRNPQE